MEPSAQNTIPNSNNPSHKNSAKLKSFLFWPAWNLYAQKQRLRGLSDLIVLWVTWQLFIPHPFAPNGHLLHSLIHFDRKLSLFKLSAPNSLAQDLHDSLRDLALECVRKLEKILLLCSCALGEALAAWCVRYSWSLAPRWLAVAR